MDVKVTYTKINKKRNDLTSPAPSIPGHDYVTKSHIENEFTGYDYGNIYELANGQMWKQVEYTFYFNYASSPEAIIYQKDPSITCKLNTLIRPYRLNLSVRINRPMVSIMAGLTVIRLSI